jgi:hypothetical protein
MHTHSLHPGHPKSDLDKLSEIIFQFGECPVGLMICLFEVVKCNFGEAMFQVVEKP